MSNNSQDQRLFCAANTAIKRVKTFLPESIKDCSMKDTCKQEPNAAPKKRKKECFCPRYATFVSRHNHFPLAAAAREREIDRNIWT